MKTSKNLLLLTTLLCTNVFASTIPVEFSDVTLSGSGCKEGTTSNIISPDGSALSILFDELNVEVPQFDGDNENDELNEDNDENTSKYNKLVNRKVCFMNISAKIPRGQMVDSVDLSFDYRGSTYTEKGTVTTFKTKIVGVNGPSGRRLKPQKLLGKKRFRGESDQEWNLSQTRNIPLNTKCSNGGNDKVKFSLKNIVTAKIMERFAYLQPEAFMMTDSADLKASVKLSIKLRKCGGTNNGGGQDNIGDSHHYDVQIRRCNRVGGRWDNRLKKCRAPRRNRRERNRRRSYRG